MIAASVVFLTTVLRPVGGGGESESANPAMPIVLSVTQSNATTDLNGLASIVPSSGGFSPPVEVDIAVTAGLTARLDDPLELLPAFASTETPPTTIGRVPVHISGPVGIEHVIR